MSAALTRQLGRESSLALYASRSTPVSAYEENAFYVSTGLQGTLQVPLPAQFQLRGGLGYQWNDYRTVASEIGGPREDRILGWYVGLRRPVRAEPLPERGLPQRGPPLQRRHLRHRRRRVLLPAGVGHLRRAPAMSPLAAVALLLLAQAPAAAAEAARPTASGPGDVLEVVVDGRPDLSRLPTVQTTGSVWLPRAGEVEVRGLTTGEIAAQVAPLLAGEDLASPRVAVRVKEYQSQFVWVRGRGAAPGPKAPAQRHAARGRAARRRRLPGRRLGRGGRREGGGGVRGRRPLGALPLRGQRARPRRSSSSSACRSSPAT